MPAAILPRHRKRESAEIGSLRSSEIYRLNAKRIFVADHDKEWQEFYKASLEKIVGHGNIDIVSSCSEGVDALKEKRYSAYVIEPALPYGSEPNGNGCWGLELANIATQKTSPSRDTDIFWMLSARHELLAKARGLGFINLYTKNILEESRGYRIKEDFVREISDSFRS